MLPNITADSYSADWDDWWKACSEKPKSAGILVPGTNGMLSLIAGLAIWRQTDLDGPQFKAWRKAVIALTAVLDKA